MTGELTSRLLSKSLWFVQTRSTQEILFSMTTGTLSRSLKPRPTSRAKKSVEAPAATPKTILIGLFG
jgi:hypothetical protein